MTGLLVIFLILWILSPLVLIPLCIHYRNFKSECYKNYYQNNNLKNLIQSLMIRGALTKEEKELYYKYVGMNHAPPNNDFTHKEDFTEKQGKDTTYQSEKVPTVHTVETSSDVKILHNTEPKPQFQKSIPIIVENPDSLESNIITNDNPYPSDEKEISKVSTISVILVVGVIFVLLSGIIFTTTTWHTLNNIVRSLLIFSASVLFFGVGTLADKKLNLQKTGMAFFSIGCFLLPIDIFAIGVFKLFGTWLSWSGDGRYLLCAIGCILVSIASYIGTKKYDSKFYASASLFGVSATVGLVIKSCLISLSGSSIFTILMALYLLLLLVLQDKFKNFLICLSDVYSLVWDKFFVVNAFILGMISLISFHFNVLFGLSIVLMGAVFIAYANQSEGIDLHYLIFSAILIVSGLYAIFKIDNLLMLSTVLVVLITIMQELNFLNSSVKDFYNKILIGSFIFGLTCLFVDNTISQDWNFLTLFSIVMCILCTTWIYLKKEHTHMLWLQSVYVVFLTLNISFIVSNTLDINIALISIMIFLAYCVYQFVPKFNSEVVLIEYSLLMGMFVIFNFDYIPITVWLITLTINVLKNDSITSKLSRYILPLSVVLMVFRVFNGFETISLINFSIMLILSVILNFKEIKSLRSIFTGYSFAIAYIYYIFAFLFDFDYNFTNILIISLLMSFSIFKVVLSKMNELNSKKVFYSNVSLINLLLVSISLLALDISLIWISFGLSVTLFALYYIIKHFQLDDDILTIVKYYTIVILEISQWYICLSDHHFMISLIIVLMNFIFAYSFKNNILTLFSIINLYYVLHDLVSTEFTQLDTHYLQILFNVIFFVVSGIVGRYLHKEFILKDKDTKKFHIDYFTIFAVFPILRVFLEYTNIQGLNAFIGFTLLSIYPLFYYNRVLFTNSKQILLSISSVALCFVFWSEPFLNIPKNIIVEWNCLPIVALSLILCIIWKGYPKVVEYSPYTSMCIVTSVISIYELIYSETLEFLVLVGIFIVSIIISKRLNTKKWKMLSTLIFCIMFWLQPIVTIPSILITEWNCIPLIVLSLSISLIWKEYPKIMECLPFYTVLLVSIVLSISAISSQELMDAFILLIGLTSVLIISFMIKRKKWFCFSTIELIVLTLYLTRSFWLSIAWWIYLLIVGLLMISIGATNEYLKMKNESLKDNVKNSTKRLFHDWKW